MSWMNTQSQLDNGKDSFTNSLDCMEVSITHPVFLVIRL
jgi:hypothetical protein